MEGTIRQTEEGLAVDFSGNAGRRPLRIWGTIKEPGPTAEVELHVRVDRFPIDDAFLRALRPEYREPLETLDPTGVADIYARFARPAGYDRKFQMQLSARLHDCSVEFEDFRYRVDELSGIVANPNGNWTFTQLRGVHGAAEMTGSGYWLTDAGRGHLTVHVEDGQLDAELKRALPEDLKELWTEFSPGGKVNLTAKVDWGADRPLAIELPQVSVTEGSMLMASFPYPVRDIAAQFHYDSRGVLWIDAFEGYRYQTRIKAKGFSQTLPNGDWRVRLNPVSVVNLPADETLLRALPDDLREALEYFNPTEPVSHRGMLEIRGTADPTDPITAAWDVTTEFSGGTLSAGLDLDKIHGRVTSAGTWDGEHLAIHGRADLSSVEIWEYKLNNLRGPFRLIDDDLQVGSPKAFQERRPGQQPIPAHERITAEAIEGVIKLDALVDFSGEESTYVAKTSISHGQLQEYSKLYVTSGDYLRGTIDGWAVLRGSGDDRNNVVGTGQLKISPAALYDLPVIAQVFERITFVPQRNGKGAFNYAQADFDIANSQFDFKSIYLRGDAISLHGRGQTSFDGKLSLDFYSRLSRNQIPIPLLNRVVSEVTKGWVGVRVRGTTAVPTTEMIPAPHLEGALKNLIGTLERGIPAAPPFLMSPPPGPLRFPLPNRDQPPRSGRRLLRNRQAR
jgi:hypothetical protein